MHSNLPTPELSQDAGILYVVATPVGNLDDITYRAVETLTKVDLIAAEDTRHTSKLLTHFGIRRPLVSCHEHNEKARVKDLVKRLEQGLNLALVTDSGTPLVSDPGFRLVSEAAAQGIRVIPIPGACAAVAALSAGGLPTDRFMFCGFLPKKKGKIVRALESLANIEATLVFYESPRRILDILNEMIEILGDRPAVLARELTKIHEEFLRGSLSEIHARLQDRRDVKGECTILVSGPSQKEADEDVLIHEISMELAEAGLSVSKLSAKLAKKHGIAKRIVYDMALELQDRKSNQ